jgi:hypothetical protein
VLWTQTSRVPLAGAEKTVALDASAELDAPLLKAK